MSLGATNKTTGFGKKHQATKKAIYNVDIQSVEGEELQERINYLRAHYMETSKAELEAIATFILTGCPF